jgi:Uma2 family endonuclease
MTEKCCSAAALLNGLFRREGDMSQVEIAESVVSEISLRLWSVDEYHRIIEAGILTVEDKVELLEGKIVQMSPQDPPHASTTQWAGNYLARLLGDRAFIRNQLPITIPPDSEPEPDIAVVRVDRRAYFDHHPMPEEIFLLIEIADSTLMKDRQQKVKTYAKANISEYWVVDVNKRQVYIFRQPEADAYTQELLLNEEDVIDVVAFPETTVFLRQLFP